MANPNQIEQLEAALDTGDILKQLALLDNSTVRQLIAAAKNEAKLREALEMVKATPIAWDRLNTQQADQINAALKEMT